MRTLPFLVLLLLSPQDETIEDHVRALREGTATERENAFKLLKSLDGKHTGKLIPYLADESVQMQEWMIEILQGMRMTDVLDAAVGSDPVIARNASRILHNVHVDFLPDDWEDRLGECLEAKPRRSIRFDQLCDDFLVRNIPVLLWPPSTKDPYPDRGYQGTYGRMLEAMCSDRGWTSWITEGGIVVYPVDNPPRRPLCGVLREHLKEAPAPSPLATLYADICGEWIDWSFEKHAGDTQGFWKHAVDIRIHRILKGERDVRGDEPVTEIAKRMNHPSWPVRALAAEALIECKKLPAGYFHAEDPYTRYLAAVVSERSRRHDPALYTLMEDRYRDIRTRALFAGIESSLTGEMDFDRMLYAIRTITEEDANRAISRIRSRVSSTRLGEAVVRVLRAGHKDLAHRFLDRFSEKEIVEAVCEEALKETEEKWQEKYLALLQKYVHWHDLKKLGRATTLAYLRLPSERIGEGAAKILIEVRQPEVIDEIASCLTEHLPAVRRRAVDTIFAWGMKHYEEYGEENDALAQILERAAANESDRGIAALARRHAGTLRARGSERPPGDRDIIGMGGGSWSRYGRRIGCGGVKPPHPRHGWRPYVAVTLPRPDFSVEK